jgi:large subunit ribosomal protein L3
VNVGDKILADVFSVNDYVDVTGVSKGRGFAGFHKRHHFGGGGASHGSMFHRAPGSIGASAWPSRVLKGMKAAGHMGHARVTVRNLRVVQVLAEENTLLVEGAVPGPQGSYVVVHKAKAPHK